MEKDEDRTRERLRCFQGDRGTPDDESSELVCDSTVITNV